MNQDNNLFPIKSEWSDNLDFAITITDVDNNIVYMNNVSKKTFPTSVIGDNLDACHSQNSNDIIASLIKNKASNTYSVQKNNITKLIHQTPWYINDEVAGLVEVSIVLPDNMQHHNRTKL